MFSSLRTAGLSHNASSNNQTDSDALSPDTSLNELMKKKKSARLEFALK
jgi:hypothetical protein